MGRAFICALALSAIACDGGGDTGESSAGECSDGRDNDFDGRTDCADLGCSVHSFCVGMTPDGGLPPPSSCNASNCGGCCSGDTCLAGNSAAACGAAGGLCVDCGPDRLCSSGSCVIDPASRWDVVVVSVSVPSQTTTGEAWDALGGAPDPFVTVYVGSETNAVGRTATANDTFSANYGVVVGNGQRADAILGYLGFQVSDEDVSAHDWIGGCFITGITDAFSGGDRVSECPRNAATGNAGFTIVWRLQRD